MLAPAVPRPHAQASIDVAPTKMPAPIDDCLPYGDISSQT